MTALGFIASHAGDLNLGLAAAFPALRASVVFATLSQLAAGSVTVVVGAGWQRTEYEAVASSSRNVAGGWTTASGYCASVGR